MLETLASLLSAIRQTSPIIFLGLSIATGIIIFVPNDIAEALGLSDLRMHYRAHFGFAFVVSISIVFAQCLWGAARFAATLLKTFRESRKAKQAMQEREKMLHDLTPDEKAYLAPYILDKENTQYFLIEDGIAGGLEAKGIIYQARDVGDMIEGFAYNLQPWVRNYLKQKPHLLEGANPNPREPGEEW